jgi:hypothetical protein
VDPDVALGLPARLPGVGRVLEGTTGPGFATFFIVQSATIVFALRSIGTQPAQSAALLSLSAMWIPLFFTLGGALLALPKNRLEPSSLEPYHSLLVKKGLPVQLIGRSPAKPESDGGLDELRLRFDPPSPLAGFDSLELALEWHHGGWSLSVRPVFIARARDGSPAHEALPRSAQWSRGRHRDERVALIRPWTAWPNSSLAVARELLRRLNRPKPIPASPPSAKRRTRRSTEATRTAPTQKVA